MGMELNMIQYCIDYKYLDFYLLLLRIKFHKRLEEIRTRLYKALNNIPNEETR